MVVVPSSEPLESAEVSVEPDVPGIDVLVTPPVPSLAVPPVLSADPDATGAASRLHALRALRAIRTANRVRARILRGADLRFARER